jgi:hypothetical protein
MKKLITAVFLILALSFPKIANSDALELQEVYLNYKKFSGDTRTPYLQLPGLEDHSLDHELNLNVNMDFWEHFYWNNTIHALNDGDYRVIGWNWRIGLHFTDYIDFGWNHFSEHYTNYIVPDGFPLQNSWEVNFYLYRKRTPGKGLF